LRLHSKLAESIFNTANHLTSYWCSEDDYSVTISGLDITR